MYVCLELHLKFDIHGILRQNITNHQILMRILIVSTYRHSYQHNVADWEFFCDQKFNMAAAKLEVALTLEINNIAEKFSRISPILLQNYFTGIIAEHLVYSGICGIQNGGQKPKVVIIFDI